jgi:hypothetical protein
MTTLLATLTPPAAALEAHARMACVLDGQRHELLRADDPVELDPGDKPLAPMRDRKAEKARRKVNPDPSRKLKQHRAQVLLALSDQPQDYRAIAAATGLYPGVVRSTLGSLCHKRKVVNLAPSGSVGRYVLPPVVITKRGAFDV